jgi:hypothetical protein
LRAFSGNEKVEKLCLRQNLNDFETTTGFLTNSNAKKKVKKK